ncbi:MAG: peptide ABC transporter substrate-binding protein, partial [Candidatus Tectomicrobia bacterium]|nr:peptide ABC transporter substrate-binding protein [Candidatus Tectomicrobia bacterium]
VTIGGGNIDRAQDEANPLHKELRIVPELSLFYIGFNHTRPPFDDPLVRKAFVQAVDKDKVVKRTTRNTLPVADGIIPPGMPGYSSDQKGLPFDPAQARASLAASKYKNAQGLPPITMTIAGEGGDISQSIGAIIDQWRVNLGVDVSVRQLESRVYFYNMRKEKDDMYDSGWIADYPDPQNFADILFRTGGEENTGDYSNPAIDAQLDQAAAELNAAKRSETYRQIERKLLDDAAIIPLWYGRAYYLVKPYVKGYVVTPLGLPMFSGVILEPH